jgi:hypothetical protein
MTSGYRDGVFSFLFLFFLFFHFGRWTVDRRLHCDGLVGSENDGVNTAEFEGVSEVVKLVWLDGVGESRSKRNRHRAARNRLVLGFFFEPGGIFLPCFFFHFPFCPSI